MEETRKWRFEVKNSQTYYKWRKLWEIETDQLEAAKELKNDLNKVNAPARLRIVRKTGF